LSTSVSTKAYSIPLQERSLPLVLPPLLLLQILQMGQMLSLVLHLVLQVDLLACTSFTC